MDNVNKKVRKDAAVTPLWVISLFLSLTEMVAGVAVIKADGYVQIALTAFVIFFPLLVAAAFFTILWNRPYVFYPPTAFSGKADVHQYVEAMRRRSVQKTEVYELVQSAIESSFRAPQISEQLNKTSQIDPHLQDQNQNECIRNIINNAQEEINNRVIRINTYELEGNIMGKTLIKPYHDDLTVSDFLNDLFFDVETSVRPFTFGKKWALKDIESGNIFLKLGSYFGEEEDKRPIRTVGLRPGMHLSAFRL